MVDQRNDKFDGEEGEYHFSDDQANYEVETETLKAPSAAKEPGSSGIGRFRRPIIAGSVFLVLMIVVYKMISPTTVVPSTEFSQGIPGSISNAKPPALAADMQKPVMEIPVSPPAPVATPVAAPVVEAAAPAAATPAAPAPLNNVPAALPQTGLAQNNSLPPTTSTDQPGLPPAQSMNPGSMPSAPPLAQDNPANANPNMMLPNGTPPVTVVNGPAPGTLPMGTSNPSAPPLQNNEVIERLAALEQQNAKLTNLLQIEYSQKISDNDSQAILMKNKLTELGKRVAGMESALNQITQLLQESAGGGASKPMPLANSYAPSSPRNLEPKQSYTVQAIIPGRAWLKSDAGDTVTVAEGDTLKQYGRITKIDPYDGVVQIDTGNKMVTLSYGLGGDA